MGEIRSTAAMSMTVLAVGLIGACGSKPPVTWPGTIENNAAEVEFYEKQYAAADIKVLCAKADGGGMQIQLTAPDGTHLVTAQQADGSPASNITIDGPNGKETLPNGAHWRTENGTTYFLLDDSGQYDKKFYMHDGDVSCPIAHT